MKDKSADCFRKIFQDLMKKGKKCAPRGQTVIEIENYTYTLPPRARFCNFEARNVSKDYIKREFLWYLRGNKHDLEILDHASMWKGLVNQSNDTYQPWINSNYGQYVFAKVTDSADDSVKKSQFDAVVETLSNDVDSRRASIAILNQGHLLSTTNDVPCTYSLNFRIRENKLNMSVHMRSQDAVFGMGNDAPCFSFIHEMVYVALRDKTYPELKMGDYHHIADSFHVYERHFKAMEEIAGGSKYIPIEVPVISNSEEVSFLQNFIHLTYGQEQRAPIPRMLVTALKEYPDFKDMIATKAKSYQFSTWLTTFDKIQEK